MGLLAKLESRTHPSNPDRWFIRAMRGSDTMSGLEVGPDEALSSTAVFAGVRWLAENVASVPLGVYRTKGRGRELARQHPAFRVLHSDPNPEQTSMEFREMLQGFAVLTGTGFAEIVFGRGGEATQLWPITPHRVRPGRTDSGALFWRVRLPKGGEDRVLPMESMFLVRGFSRDGILGVDVVDMMRESIGLTLATEKFGAAFFGNGSHPAGVITVPELLSDTAYARLQDSWNKKHQGLQNAHRAAILEEGASWLPMGVPPEAAQFLQTRKFQVAEVARMLNVPPHVLKDLERATFSNIEQQSIEAVRYSLRPWFVRWEQRLDKQILTQRDQEQGYYTRHTIEGLLRGDIQTRYTAYSVGRQNGWLSVNDVRELEDLNPVEEGGDDYHIQVNMVRLSDIDLLLQEPDESPASEDEGAERSREDRTVWTSTERRSIATRVRQRQAYERLLVDTAQRAVRREAGGVRAALRKGFGGRDAASFRIEMAKFYEAHRTYLIQTFEPLLRSFGDVLYLDVANERHGPAEMPPAVSSFRAEYVKQFAARQTTSSQRQLEALLRDNPDTQEEAIEQRVAEWEEKWPEKIGRREAHRYMNALTYAAYMALGVVVFRWATITANCPYCNLLNGMRVRADEAFALPGAEMDPGGGLAPMKIGGLTKHPPLHDGCDCVVVASS